MHQVGAGLALAGTAGVDVVTMPRHPRPALESLPRTPAQQPEEWGLQLYTVRSLMAEDVERTLAEVAAIGYGEVEFAGYFGRPPAQVKASLDAEGLVAPAVHLSLEELRSTFDEAVLAAQTIGHRYFVLPFISGSDRPSGSGAEIGDGYSRLAGEMNDIGQRCQEAGLRFAYHNHDFELVETDGVRPLDILLDRTDPGLVDFELDFYWLEHGGGDPFDYFARHPGRFSLCHVKDRTPSGDMVDVGAGAIDFAAIFERSAEAGLLHYFVEHDSPGDPLQSVRASYDHLAGLGR